MKLMTKKPKQTAVFGVPEYKMKWEGTYRPPISTEHLRRLWDEKLRTKKPITKIVDEAIGFYFDNK